VSSVREALASGWGFADDRRRQAMSRLLQLRRESIGFAVGSLCFAVAACPGYLGLVGEDWTNAAFFTTASFIQLRLTGRWRRGAWKSKQDWDDWWSAASRLIGTFFFNYSTFARCWRVSAHPRLQITCGARMGSDRFCSLHPGCLRSSLPNMRAPSGTLRSAAGGVPD
jgi:hypothetical protein